MFKNESLEQVLDYALRVPLVKGVDLYALLPYLVLPRFLLLRLLQAERRPYQVRVRVDVLLIEVPSDLSLQV